MIRAIFNENSVKQALFARNSDGNIGNRKPVNISQNMFGFAIIPTVNSQWDPT